MPQYKGFFEYLVDSCFAKDDRGRMLFYPATYGRGRIVSDADREAALRRSVSKVQIFMLFGMPAIGAIARPRGWLFLPWLAAAVLIGLLVVGYLQWISRDLERSDVRRSVLQSSRTNLSRASTGFLRFGVITSAIFTFVGAAMIAAGSGSAFGDLIAGLVAVLFFGPLTFLYWRALRSRNAEMSDAA